MQSVRNFPAGGYRYIDGVFQFSGGVAAEPGYAIERVRFADALPLEEAFEAVEAHLAAIGRPTTSICAFELRSPAPFTEQGFIEFNRRYIKTLERWGLIDEGRNPVARTNVCPAHNKPTEPSIFSFAYTVPSDVDHDTFIVTGSAEAREGDPEYHDSIVRLGDTSLDGLRDKIRFVRAEQERRLSVLGFTWKDALAVRAYSLHDVGPLLNDELISSRSGRSGLLWQLASPPVQNCEFEMDARTVLRETVKWPAGHN